MRMRESVLHSRGWCLRISLYTLGFMCLILASYSNITFFEILHLMYPNCPCATEARSQCDDVMLHMLLQ